MQRDCELQIRKGRRVSSLSVWNGSYCIRESPLGGRARKKEKRVSTKERKEGRERERERESRNGLYVSAAQTHEHMRYKCLISRHRGLKWMQSKTWSFVDLFTTSSIVLALQTKASPSSSLVFDPHHVHVRPSKPHFVPTGEGEPFCRGSASANCNAGARDQN